mgnify:CR=1 FL=1
MPSTMARVRFRLEAPPQSREDECPGQRQHRFSRARRQHRRRNHPGRCGFAGWCVYTQGRLPMGRRLVYRSHSRCRAVSDHDTANSPRLGRYIAMGTRECNKDFTKTLGRCYFRQSTIGRNRDLRPCPKSMHRGRRDDEKFLCRHPPTVEPVPIHAGVDYPVVCWPQQLC